MASAVVFYFWSGSVDGVEGNASRLGTSMDGDQVRIFWTTGGSVDVALVSSVEDRPGPDGRMTDDGAPASARLFSRRDFRDVGEVRRRLARRRYDGGVGEKKIHRSPPGEVSENSDW